MIDGPAQARTRPAAELRPFTMARNAAAYAEGSCLITMGDTRVLCTASVEQGVPGWRRGSGQGWVTAEYAMLPRATQERTSRERNHLGGRTQEIQRLIGRSLRACVDMRALGEWTIRIDCDVLQADGGTRTASITGAAVALHDACAWVARRANLNASPFQGFVAAVSTGIVGGQVLLDLNYQEDSTAEVDLNVVALESGGLIEVQGTAERAPFTPAQLTDMVGVAGRAIDRLIHAQREVIGQ
jgi:ribonuclease PH